MKERSQSSRPPALDPKNYDIMFPELSVSADPSRRASAPVSRTFQGESISCENTIDNTDDTNHTERNGTASKTGEDLSVTTVYDILESDSLKPDEGTAAKLEALKNSYEALCMGSTVYQPPLLQKQSSIVNSSCPSPHYMSVGPVIKPCQQGGFFQPSPQAKFEVPLEPDFDLYPDLPDPGDVLGYPPPVLPHPTPDLVVTPPEGPPAAFYYPPPPVPLFPSYYDFNTRTFMWYPSLLQPPSIWSWPQIPPEFPFLMQPNQPFCFPPFPPANFSTPDNTPSATPANLHMRSPAQFHNSGQLHPPPFRPLSSAGLKRRPPRPRTRRRARSLSSREGTPELLTSLTSTSGENRRSHGEDGVWPKPAIPGGFNWSYYSYTNGQAPLVHTNEQFRGSDIAAPRDHDPLTSIHSGQFLENVDNQRLERASPVSTDAFERYQSPSSISNGPPANAPTAPASHRRSINSQAPQVQPKTPAGNRPESGKWSQSKRWMSQETKERLAFQKMMLSLHYMGADESPFVPQTPAELTALKADAAEGEKRKLVNQVDRLMSKGHSKRDDDGQGGNAVPTVKLFGGRQLQDKLSPILALENYFNRTISVGDKEHIEWPSLAELKEEGDKRGGRYKRCLPRPRLNRVAPRITGKDRENSYHSDGTIRWEMKEAKQDLDYLLPTPKKEAEPVFIQNGDLQKSHLPQLVQLLLDEIDNDALLEDDIDCNEEENDPVKGDTEERVSEAT